MQRISITVDESLAQAFDELIAKRGYQNRSEAFRDLLKKELAQEALVNPSQECVAVVSYAYDHRKALLSKRNVDHQHEHPSLADSGKQKALNSLIISEFRAFLNYCLVYMLEHVFNQFRNCLLCCKSYS